MVYQRRGAFVSGIALTLLVGSGSISVTASPPSLITGGTTSGFTTPSTAMIVSGGAGAPVYSWAIFSDDGIHSFSVTSPSASATTVHIGGIVAGDTCDAVLLGTVTDGGSDSVTVPIFHTDYRTPA